MAETVQLFVTCLVDSLYPHVGNAVVSVLRRAGVEVAFPVAQTCCGQPAFNAGMWEQARPVACHTIQVFERTRGAVIVPSGSCAAMLRHSYLELFAEDREWLPRAQALAERVFEFSEFLVDHLGVVDLGASYNGRLTYHPSCHLLREMQIARQPRMLLSAVRGAQIVDLPNGEQCCGFGGVFSAEFPQVSSAMLANKISSIQSSEAPLVVSCDAGCITNINGGLHRRGLSPRAVHLAEILDHRQEDCFSFDD